HAGGFPHATATVRADAGLEARALRARWDRIRVAAVLEGLERIGRGVVRPVVPRRDARAARVRPVRALAGAPATVARALGASGRRCGTRDAARRRPAT